VPGWHLDDGAPAEPGRDRAAVSKSAAVIIGASVWLGRCATVLPGRKIGDHTALATGPVVKAGMPPRTVADNPAWPDKQ
jgi:acetyltransferase-like isoleucine patch superfamily enzyme